MKIRKTNINTIILWNKLEGLVLKRLIAKKIGYPLMDFMLGSKILETKRFLEKSQWWSKERIEEFQNKKLRRLIKHSYENVTYYHSIFKKINLYPTDIKTVRDLKKIPLLTKEIARKENDKLVSHDINRKKIFIKNTGGTTGAPLKIYRDMNDMAWIWAAYFRWYDWMNVDIGDPITVIWGAPIVTYLNRMNQIKNYLIDNAMNKIVIDSFTMNNKTLPKYVKKIKKQDPVLIRGYLSGILQLANYLKENNINDISPKACSTTTETLLPIYRKFLEKQFNCEIFDQYGCGESNSMAFECNEHNGLHITSEHCVVELGDGVGNSEGNGDIILTNLDNFAMPLIRYINDDLSSFNENTCDCGRKLPLIKSIDGRVADTITLKDEIKVHGVFFTDIICEIGWDNKFNIEKFQVIQTMVGSIEFKIVCKPHPNEKEINLLYQKLLPFFSNVELKFVEDIPLEKSGKYRYVKSQIE